MRLKVEFWVSARKSRPDFAHSYDMDSDSTYPQWLGKASDDFPRDCLFTFAYVRCSQHVWLACHVLSSVVPGDGDSMDRTKKKKHPPPVHHLTSSERGHRSPQYIMADAKAVGSVGRLGGGRHVSRRRLTQAEFPRETHAGFSGSQAAGARGSGEGL